MWSHIILLLVCRHLLIELRVWLIVAQVLGRLLTINLEQLAEGIDIEIGGRSGRITLALRHSTLVANFLLLSEICSIDIKIES